MKTQKQERRQLPKDKKTVFRATSSSQTLPAVPPVSEHGKTGRKIAGLVLFCLAVGSCGSRSRFTDLLDW
ncbi:hypothetical protein E2C01_071095 [Portunus trituberculatus]|uniref:Uncharacterized protein n=1 Tax=Portunus trituberculatus TaxID=210409 RepID=A0A5B7HUH1_PORTR|nr:hypothetical protein [Portunus trituberculatus]